MGTPEIEVITRANCQRVKKSNAPFSIVENYAAAGRDRCFDPEKMNNLGTPVLDPQFQDRVVPNLCRVQQSMVDGNE